MTGACMCALSSVFVGGFGASPTSSYPLGSPSSRSFLFQAERPTTPKVPTHQREEHLILIFPLLAMKFTSLSSFAALLLLLTPSSVEACRRRRLAADDVEDERDILPLTIRAGIVPGAFPVFLDRDETDGSISGFLMDWLEEIQCQALFQESANPYRYNVTYNFVDLDGLPTVSTYNGAEATITDGCEDLATTDGVGCLDMLVGDYFITSERTQLFTFPPQPFSAAPVVGFYSTNSDTAYATIEEANNAGGTVCVLEDSAVGNLYAPFIENPVLCGPNIPACAERVSAGDCDYGFGGSIFVSYAQKELPDLVLTDAPVPEGTFDEEVQFYVSTPVRSSLNPAVLQNLNIWSENAVNPGLIDLTREYFGQETIDDHIARETAFDATYSVTLRVAVMVYAPYVYLDEDGKLTGLSVEHLRALEEASDGDLILDFTEVTDENASGVLSTPGNVYNPTGFYNDAIVALPESPFDIIVGPFAASVERQENAIFPFRFVWQQLVLFRLVDSPNGIETLEEANAQSAGVCILDGTLVTAPKDLIISNPVTCASVDGCYNSLANGECDLMVDWVLDGFANAAFAIPGVPVTFAPFGEEEMPAEFEDGFFYSYPLRRDLPPSSYVRYNTWLHQVRNDGATIELFEEFFGPFIPTSLLEGEDGEDVMDVMSGVVDEDVMAVVESMMEGEMGTEEGASESDKEESTEDEIEPDTTSASHVPTTMLGLGLVTFTLSYFSVA